MPTLPWFIKSFIFYYNSPVRWSHIKIQ